MADASEDGGLLLLLLLFIVSLFERMREGRRCEIDAKDGCNGNAAGGLEVEGVRGMHECSAVKNATVPRRTETLEENWNSDDADGREDGERKDGDDFLVAELLL
jgi:hypothetical protein